MNPIDDAKAQMKKHAASALARKEELQGRLVKLIEQRQELVDSAEAATASGAAELLAEIHELLPTVEQQIESLEGQVAMAANTVDEVMKEMADLDGDRSQLERDALVGKVRALTGSDPFSADPIDRALANVREHAASMNAELSMSDELSPPRPSAADKEAAVRAQLEALKAKRRAAAAAAPSDEPADPAAKPKRTL